MPKLMYSEPEQWEYYSQDPWYMISSYGRVYSIKTKRHLRWMKKYGENGRLKSVAVSINQKPHTVHSLVAAIWLPPRPSIHHTLDHINRNPLNNFYKNIRWATPNEQVKNSVQHLKRGFKFSTEDIERLYQRSKKETLHSIGKEYGLSKSQLSTILRYVHPLY